MFKTHEFRKRTPESKKESRFEIVEIWEINLVESQVPTLVFTIRDPRRDIVNRQLVPNSMAFHEDGDRYAATYLQDEVYMTSYIWRNSDDPDKEKPTFE